MKDSSPELIDYAKFTSVDIRAGTICQVEAFPKAIKPAWRLVIDFGPDIGLKKSSAQITELYQQSDLVGKQVLAVINFPVKQIANFQSEVLVLGLSLTSDKVVLVSPDQAVANGSRLHYTRSAVIMGILT